MKPGMHDDPFGAEKDRGVDIGSEVLLDRITDIGRVFGDIDRRRGMEAEMHPVAFASSPQHRGAGLVDRPSAFAPVSSWTSTNRTSCAAAQATACSSDSFLPISMPMRSCKFITAGHP